MHPPSSITSTSCGAVTRCEVTTDVLDAAELLEAVRSPLAGAAVLFVGSVREFTGEGDAIHRTDCLTYESYVPMAEKEMRAILTAAATKWSLTHAAAVHRIGTLELGELAVVVAVSSPHRDASFEAGREVLEQIKRSVPIWKKDHSADGTAWVDPGRTLSPVDEGSR